MMAMADDAAHSMNPSNQEIFENVYVVRIRLLKGDRHKFHKYQEKLFVRAGILFTGLPMSEQALVPSLVNALDLPESWGRKVRWDLL